MDGWRRDCGALLLLEDVVGEGDRCGVEDLYVFQLDSSSVVGLIAELALL